MLSNITSNIHLYLFLSLCLIVTSCIDEGPTDNIINSSDAFKIDLYEDLEHPDSRLLVSLESFEEFDCTNYVIETFKTSSDNNTQIEFVNIQEPEVCLEGQGPASAEIYVETQLNSEQEVKFSFNDEIVDIASLIESKDTYELELKTSYGIKSYISILHKIPNNSLTLIFEYNSEDLFVAIEKYIERLKSFGEDTELPNGYYGHFLVEENTIKPKLADHSNSIGLHLDLSNLTHNELDSLLTEIELTTSDLDPMIQLSIFNKMN